MDKTEIIGTESGKIQGYIDNGIKIFKGIPYAEPPIGDLRFKPPVKKKPWEGIFDAMEYGSYAFQGDFPLEKLLHPKPEESEDCLTLNIWTPTTDDKKRPVMVWIHGGGFIAGGSATPVYDGSALAIRGDLVVVSINYRLGAFGFLYISGISANAGIFDQIAALKWIQKNIGVFGGDPKNVTIFGQSAGGCSVISLLGMPAAKGLFNRVIAQSVPILQPNPTIKSTNNLMKKLGLQLKDIEALREIKAEDIINAQNKVMEEVDEWMAFRPSIDIEGKTLPIHPLEAIKKGEGKNIDLLIGCTEEEGKLTTYFVPNLKDLKAENLEQQVTDVLRPLNLEKNSNNLIQKYENARKNLLPIKPIDILNVIITDFVFRMPEIHIAEAQSKHNSNVYFYMFTWSSPLIKAAGHFVEIPFVFGTLDLKGNKYLFGKGPEAKKLSEKTMDAWIAFARSGNPNHDNIPEWPIYDTKNRATMMMGKEFKVVNAPFEKERVAWDGLHKW